LNFIKKHSLPIFLILASLSLAILGEDLTKYLIYNRSEIGDAQLWRFITAHLVHLGWNHLWLNLSVLVIIWFLVKDFLSIKLWWLVALISSIGISLGLYLFMSELQWYVGLSGLLHSLLVCGAVIGISKGKKEFIFLLIFVFIKIIYEQFYGSLNMELIRGDVVVNAHFYGVVMGLVCIFGFVVLKRFKSTDF